MKKPLPMANCQLPICAFHTLHFGSRISVVLVLVLALVLDARATQVLFPLNQMFGQSNYVQTFQIKAVRPLLTDNAHVFVGSFRNVTPTGGTNPVVTLTPNDYLVTFSDASTPWRISVPDSAGVLNALTLTSGTLPTFNYQPPFGTATNLDGEATNQVVALGPLTMNRFIGASFSAEIFGSKLFIFAGDNPMSMVSITGTNAVYTAPAGYGLRDPGLIKIGTKFYVVYNNDQSNSLSVICSTNLVEWSELSTLYVPLPTNYVSVWSPKPLLDANGDLWLTALVGHYDGFDGTDPMISYLNGMGRVTGNFTAITNFTLLSLSQNPPGNYITDSNSGAIFPGPGSKYYLLTGNGNEYSSTNLSNTNWLWVTNGLLAGAGKAMIDYKGQFYLTSGETDWKTWQTSTDMVHWSAIFTGPGLLPEIPNGWHEGTFASAPAPLAVSGAIDAGTIYGKFNGAAVDFGRIVADGSGLTNLTLPRQIPLNHATRFRFCTFQAGNGATNGVWFFSGFTPTNLVLESYEPTFADTTTNNVNVRDPFQFKYTDNSGITTYLLVYTTHYGDLIYSRTPGPGLATSPDGIHWTQRGYIAIGTNYFAQWSPKLFVDATNGLHLAVALGTVVDQGPTNPFIADLNIANPLQISNLRPLFMTDDVDGPEASTGTMFYTNGLYFYFSSAGKEWTNNSLSTTGWALVTPDKILSTAGESVVLYNGLWYWFATDGQLVYTTSTDLFHWSTPIVATNWFQEGSAIIEDYAAPLPQSMPNGTLIFPHLNGTNVYWTTSDFGGTPSFSGDGAGLTNLQGVLVTVRYTNTTAGSIQFTTNAGNVYEWIGTNGLGGGGMIPNGLVTNNAPAAVVVTNAGVSVSVSSNLVMISSPSLMSMQWLTATSVIHQVSNGTITNIFEQRTNGCTVIGATNLVGQGGITLSNTSIGNVDIRVRNAMVAQFQGDRLNLQTTPTGGANTQLRSSGINTTVSVDASSYVAAAGVTNTSFTAPFSGNGGGLTNLPTGGLASAALQNLAALPGNGTNHVRVIYSDSTLASLAVGCFTNVVPANALANVNDRVVVKFTMDLSSWTQPWSIRLQQAGTNLLIMNRTTAGLTGGHTTFCVELTRTNNSYCLVTDGYFNYQSGYGSIGQDNTVGPIGKAVQVDFTSPILIWSSNAPANNVLYRASQITYYPAMN